MKKTKLFLVAFLQAFDVVVYCILVSSAIKLLSTLFNNESEFLSVSLMLALLVLSAAITGSIVFGYSVYLVLSKSIKDALLLFVYTMLCLIAFILLIALILLIW